MRYLCLLAIAAMSTLLTAAEPFVPSPLQLIEERVDEHDKEITELKNRVAKLECEQKAAKANASKLVSAAVVNPASVIVPTERVVSETVVTRSHPIITETIVSPVLHVSPAPVVSGARRLKTTSELASEIARKRTRTSYGFMARGQQSLVYQHLVNEHGYASSQVRGLSLSDALMLHNLAHGPKIDPYTNTSQTIAYSQSVIASPVNQSIYVPVSQSVSAEPIMQWEDTDCANGNCANASRSSSQRSSRWYPGKFLFRR